MDNLHLVNIDKDKNALTSIKAIEQKDAVQALESGKVVFLPNYFFDSQQPYKNKLFTEQLLDGKHKNISFDNRHQSLGGCDTTNQVLYNELKQLLKEYADFTYELISILFPTYVDGIKWGRTSYRPAEIKGRASSKRKDDTRLHVDSFAATPVQGERILRVFCNINPDKKPRVWHLGESFPQVMQQFSSRIPTYNKFTAHLLKFIKITKSLRTAYDHYQLQLHDRMKLDDNYQNQVKKQQVDFPAFSTWIVFTDQVSHAALSGQYLFEQTFYLPVTAMANPQLSPLKYWEKEKQTVLV